MMAPPSGVSSYAVPGGAGVDGVMFSAPTAASLPGMGWELNNTVSSEPSSTNFDRPLAIWVSAARGSPWEPVHTMQTRLSITHGSAVSDCAACVIVPLIVALRAALGLDFQWELLPLTVAAYFVGQALGARWRRRLLAGQA